MYSIGDLVIYSSYGICHIDDICEKTFLDVTKSYYIMHPLENGKLTISAPVDSNKVTMSSLMDKPEAEEILESFRQEGADWIEIKSQRAAIYSDLVKTGDRRQISKILNTLMRKKREAESAGRTFSEKDNRLLLLIQGTMFAELAMALNTTTEDIGEKVCSIIAGAEQCQ